MPSPTFDGKTIFDSLDSDNNNFSEGCLTPTDFQWLKQVLHFNGEQGNRMLWHGCADRQWIFEGHLSAPSLGALQSIIQKIEGYINKSAQNVAQNVNMGTYYTMTDSFSSPYPYAQIHSFHYLEFPQAITSGGYVCRVRVEGVILGMEMEG